ncbi:MAG: hypothetical protein ACNI3C_07720 [Candidatus Marinarcus sp.]|uniref:hypothetical protein n=1 Tax=Candidatus Marinarcus sp. TaxID=3100987 RepID=UPI003B003AE4
MHYKTKLYFRTLFFTLCSLLGLILYLNAFHTITAQQKNEKNALIRLHGLPDLALSTEAMYTRHRSLSDVFSLFKESPSLFEYFPTTFVYNYSNSINNTPSKILHEKN